MPNDGVLGQGRSSAAYRCRRDPSVKTSEHGRVSYPRLPLSRRGPLRGPRVGAVFSFSHRFASPVHFEDSGRSKQSVSERPRLAAVLIHDKLFGDSADRHPSGPKLKHSIFLFFLFSLSTSPALPVPRDAAANFPAGPALFSFHSVVVLEVFPSDT